ncbi:hypothetical protein ACRALDRAFT_207982 [Sodiomyces alcalophilus JCM 7366]|uniref:uncharacterized protein n=1 Tax=Sodiomyces alcalophilus JCM 7366 TaxID=591952 RepID=UPI0039B66E34
MVGSGSHVCNRLFRRTRTPQKYMFVFIYQSPATVPLEPSTLYGGCTTHSQELSVPTGYATGLTLSNKESAPPGTTAVKALVSGNWPFSPAFAKSNNHYNSPKEESDNKRSAHTTIGRKSSLTKKNPLLGIETRIEMTTHHQPINAQDVSASEPTPLHLIDEPIGHLALWCIASYSLRRMHKPVAKTRLLKRSSWRIIRITMARSDKNRLQLCLGENLETVQTTRPVTSSGRWSPSSMSSSQVTYNEPACITWFVKPLSCKDHLS